MSEHPSQPEILKTVDYLTKRLDDTLRHSQVSTRNIYAVNGAVLAAVYFILTPPEDLSALQFLVGAVASFVLAGVNYLHANFLRDQNSWYGAIDAQIRDILVSFDSVREAWPQPLHEYRNVYEESANGERSKTRTGRIQSRLDRLLLVRRSFWTYPGIHLLLTIVLLGVGVVLAVASICKIL